MTTGPKDLKGCPSRSSVVYHVHKYPFSTDCHSFHARTVWSVWCVCGVVGILYSSWCDDGWYSYDHGTMVYRGLRGGQRARAWRGMAWRGVAWGGAGCLRVYVLPVTSTV